MSDNATRKAQFVRRIVQWIARLSGRPWPALALVAAVAGCSTGPMNINETYYLKADNGHDANYFRINVTGATQLGNAQFRQGWYPADAVDALFGDVTPEGSARALTTQEDFRQAVDSALVDAEKQYLQVAKDPKSDDDAVQKALEAVRRVRLTPLDTLPGKNAGWNSVFMEYDPKSSLVTRHAGQKLVLLLSSDPTDVISKIANLAEDTKTEQMFNKLADVVAAEHSKKAKGPTVADLTAREQLRQNATKALVAQIDSAVAKLNAGAPKKDVLAQIDVLLRTLKNIPD